MMKRRSLNNARSDGAAKLSLAQTYNNLSGIYDSQCKEFNRFFEKILIETERDHLTRGSKILDVGSGPGTPVAFHFTNQGHFVTGIDFSPGMLEVARKKVPQATFIQVENMTAYQPARLEEYDAIIASHSLYHISLSQLRSMLLRFSLWLKKGGLLIIAHCIDQQLLNEGKIIFDHRGWAEAPGAFLGEPMDTIIIGTPDAWRRLMIEMGFDIVRAEENHEEVQLEGRTYGYQGIYFVARKIEENPWIGPFPIPERVSIQKSPWPLSLSVWKQVLQNLTGDAFELTKFLEGKKYNQALYFGDSDCKCSVFTVETTFTYIV
ncbi:MAG TPA: class I SAM-dependent methyltransferase [Chlamydiales bacterium]|nr:class I SAM-dependent methyltransferase [Chlamydiales bacterium]